MPSSTEQTAGRTEDRDPEARHGTDAAMTTRLVRKIDWHIIPLLFTTYIFNFMDKTILSSASVFGLREDNVSLYIWSPGRDGCENGACTD